MAHLAAPATGSPGRRAVSGYMPLSDRTASVAVSYAVRGMAGRRSSGSFLVTIEFIEASVDV